MAEYIEREAALKCICSGCFEVNMKENAFCGVPCDDYERVSKLPAADVLPVVRGRDICGTVNGHCEFKCSVCGVELSSVYGGNNDFGLDGGYFNFCPNCGAWMEES